MHMLLGLDHHTEDFIKRLVDFLLEIELDLAEFTVLTPFPHTRAYDDLKQEDRIFSSDWNDFSADKVVYHPKQMSAGKLQELLYYAWDTFYKVVYRCELLSAPGFELCICRTRKTLSFLSASFFFILGGAFSRIPSHGMTKAKKKMPLPQLVLPIPCMYLGARTQKYVPARLIKGMLCVCVLFVAGKYILGFIL
jgi:hypothetical protein